MAILALATDLPDLRRKLGAITVGYTPDGERVTAEDVKAAGAMAVLLKDAIKPNIVQTLEGQLCFMHAGPFANIAHGNNSIIADRIALKLGEFVITESGFAADLGMEKFMDIVCRVGGLRPHVVVVVATVRALRHHGGGDWREKASDGPDAAEVEAGMANLAKHIENVRAFGIQPVVAINTRPDDEPELLELIKARCRSRRVRSAPRSTTASVRVGRAPSSSRRSLPPRPRPSRTSRCSTPTTSRSRRRSRRSRRPSTARTGIDLAPAAREAIARLEKQGLAHLPICMAKTHLSLSHDPLLRNRPSELRRPDPRHPVYSGAGMLVPLCGDMLQMPGFGAQPAAFAIDIDEHGETDRAVLGADATQRATPERRPQPLPAPNRAKSTTFRR